MYPKFCVIFFQLYPTHSRSVYDPTGMILAILYSKVPHMLHAKYQANRPTAKKANFESLIGLVFNFLSVKVFDKN